MADTPPSSAPGDNTAAALELFLLTLRYKEGQLRPLEANTPTLLDDSAMCFVVYTGNVDLFAVHVRDGEVRSPRRHLLRAEVGELVFGLGQAQAEAKIALLASGVPGTKVLHLRLSRLRQLAADIEYQQIVASMVERWVAQLGRALARTLPPKTLLPLAVDQTTALKTHEAAFSGDSVLWIKLLAGAAHWAGRADMPLGPDQNPVPLAPSTWVHASEPTTLAAVTTATLLAQEADWASLLDFHTLALKAIAHTMGDEASSERERLRQKADTQRVVVQNAFVRISSLLDGSATAALTPSDEPASDALLAACRLVGAAQGITLRAAPGARPEHSPQQALRQIAKASNVRVRQVALKGGWWHEDNGPLLAWIEASGQPVALLSATPRRYVMHNAGTTTPVTPQIAATLAPTGFMFYRPLPRRALSAWDLLSFAVRESKGDLGVVVLTGVAAGLLAVVGPIATGIIFDRVVPEAARSELFVIGLVLLTIAIASAQFQILRGIAMLRVEGKTTAVLQAALWDRLLSLPVAFFRNYSAGDLGTRVMGINTIRQAISGPVLNSVLSGVFSVFNLGLLFFYDRGLALVATGLVLLAFVVTTLTGYIQVRYQRALSAIEGRISGTVLQFINGIAKFRVAGAQHHAFTTWADQFVQQRKLAYSARTIGNGLSVFNAAYPVITSLAIFAAVAASLQRGLSTGEFLAFNAAFAQLLFAALMLSGALTSIFAIVPVYERTKPILQTLPEVNEAKLDPGELTGGIEVNHVSFRYTDNGPLVLKDVSLQIKPGEFVAVVGPSGSGKSSLLRLLLGFDEPESGAVYYDGQDLNNVDLESVRRQIGVVLQNGRIMSGLLLQNIIGSSLLTVDDAWEAARLAGLDEDIKRMPMGMFTMISEGAGTLSGGQRQRLMIARAVASKPRIVFFDEATSALDNRTQEIVSRSLEGLQATRVVIAHRLSTISNAHRIFVVNGGQIVQSGTYSELIAQPGLFAELAKRQLG